MSRIALLDGHQHEVVEDALGRHMDVDNLGQEETHQRQEQPLGCLAHVDVLHGRHSDDSCGIDRVLAVGDCRDVEDRERLNRRIVAGVIAEGTLWKVVVGLHITLDHDFRLRWDLERLAYAVHELHWPASQPSSQQVFVDVGGQWGRRAPHGGRVAAQNNRCRYL